MQYTAIFGGTFNPPHIGHYEMLAALERQPEIESVWLTPTKIPPHKVCDYLAGDRERAAMCRILAADFKKATVCLTEFGRDGKSYTYDTVSLLQKQYPEKNFAFVCGGDMLTSFHTWYRYEELMKMLPFFIFRRTDMDDGTFDEKTADLSRRGMNMTVMNQKITAISSTYIRGHLKESRALLPKKIYDYIENGGIYGVRTENGL